MIFAVLDIWFGFLHSV